MKVALFAFTFLTLTACSSTPKYEHMRTTDQALNDQDQDSVQPGMAITKKGAVVDITVEEVQAQKRRIIAEKAELEQALKNLREDLAAAELENRTLRMHLGLSAVKPKAKSNGIDPSGNVISFQRAPTIEEELAVRKPASNPEPSGE